MLRLLNVLLICSALNVFGTTTANVNGVAGVIDWSGEGFSAHNGNTNVNTQLGVLWSDSFGRADGAIGNGWQVLGGSSGALVSGKLHFAEGGFDATHNVWNTNYITSSENFNVRCRFTVPAITSTSTGPAVGWWVATNQVIAGLHRGYLALLACDSSSQGTLYLYRFDGGALTVVASSSAISPTPVALDVMEVNIKTVGFTITATGKDITQNSSVVSVSATCNTLSGDNYASNPRNVTFIPVNGTSDVSLLEYRNLEYTRAQGMIIGHSITQGWKSDAKANRWADIVAASNSTARIVVYAGGSQTTGTLLASMWEMTNYWPMLSLADLAGNDIYAGTATATWQTNCLLIMSNMDFYGRYPSWVNLQTPQNAADFRALNNFYTNRFSARYVDSFAYLVSGASDLAAAYDSGDGGHLNALGHYLVATNIVAHLSFPR